MGIYQDDLIFALVIRETLYLKVDAVSQPDFECRQLLPFTYVARGKPVSVCYFSAPPEVFESNETMRLWTDSALAAARRSRTAPKRC